MGECRLSSTERICRWDGGPWSLATFVQPGLALIAKRIASGRSIGGLDSVPIEEAREAG